MIPKSNAEGDLDLPVVLVSFASSALPDALEKQRPAGSSAFEAPSNPTGKNVFISAVINPNFGFVDSEGNQIEGPVALDQALLNTFRNERCTKCHGINADPAGDTSFPIHPGGATNNDNSGCRQNGCHTPDVTGGPDNELDGWRAPTVAQDIDFRNKSAEELATRAREFFEERAGTTFDEDPDAVKETALEHLGGGDSRITWALELGTLPNSINRNVAPSTAAQFTAHAEAWIEGGFQASPAGAVKSTIIVSRTAGGAGGNAESTSPSVTFVANDDFDPNDPSSQPAGTVFVAFDSNASDLAVAGGANRDVYRASFFLFKEPSESGAARSTSVRLEFVSMDLVSVATDGSSAANGDSSSPAISRDGQRVAYRSLASDVVDGFTDGNGDDAGDIFLRDLGDSSSTLLSATEVDGTAGGDADSREPQMSGQGSVVAFVSDASDLAEGDDGAAADIFVFQDGSTDGLSRITAALGNAASAPSLFADNGTIRVAFVAVDDESGQNEVFLFDSSTNDVRRLSESSDGTAADGASQNPSISADGAVVTYETAAANLDERKESDANGASDIVLVDVRETQTIQTQRLSVAPEGVDSDGASTAPHYASFRGPSGEPTGQGVVFFQTTASNLGSSERSDLVALFLGELEEDETTDDETPVDENTAPVCDITGPQLALVGDNVEFDGSGSSDPDNETIVDFTFDFDDGTSVTSGESTAQHSFTAAGEYIVELTVADGRGLNSGCSTTIRIHQAPVCAFSITSPLDTPNELESIDFDASASSDPDGTDLTFAWDFGDGNQDSGAMVSHSYSTGGDYTVTLTVT
ncbi:MAG: PKD domain-containing protein, partial [Planctomycetota bacterium]